MSTQTNTTATVATSSMTMADVFNGARFQKAWSQHTVVNVAKADVGATLVGRFVVVGLCETVSIERHEFSDGTKYMCLCVETKDALRAFYFLDIYTIVRKIISSVFEVVSMILDFIKWVFSSIGKLFSKKEEAAVEQAVDSTNAINAIRNTPAPVIDVEAIVVAA